MRPALIALTVSALVLLSGCAPEHADDGRVHIVASTNVYGAIAAEIGGDRVDVASIVSDASQDPHSVEASARTQLALSRADLVIENGGGYDDYVDTMLSALDASTAVVINAVDVSGYEATGGFNEHVWYDVPTMQKLVEKVATELSRLDPDGATGYSDRAAVMNQDLQAIANREAELAGALGGAAVVVTEPVPGYMLDALGLDDVTPAEFSEAIENETDVPARVLTQTLNLVSSGDVLAIIYNEQTTSPQTELVAQTADAAAVPVVPVTETLTDPSAGYIAWLSAAVDRVANAVQR
jgi:zinc/manganese transport system substrate-binding protein